MPDNLLIESTGLTSSDLSLATATTSDVMSGKSFYSGNDTLKYGIMTLSATATEADVASGKTFYAGSTTRRTGSYKKSYTKVYLGRNPGFWTNFSYNVKANYPSIYASLTRANFYAVPVKYKGNSNGATANEGGLGDNCWYDTSSGIFTGYTTNVGPGGSWAANVIYDFYMVY